MNLNFTAGREAMASAIGQCGIRTIVTSKVFLAKAKFEAMEGMVLSGRHSGAQRKRLREAARADRRAVDAGAIACAANGSARRDSLATVIFSSGSTGVPKGVMLSHYNILSNIEAMAQVFWINEQRS